MLFHGLGGTRQELAPQGLSKSGLVQYLAALVPQSRWDPELLATQSSLVTSTNMAAVTALAASRSPAAKLASLTTPTLLIQGRHDFLFDIDQALAAYASLAGPKELYIGDIGHPPAPNPTAENQTLYGRALAWFDRYLKGTGAAPTAKVELAH